ncbi:MAG: amino acid ABC transporter permease [Deltaproteobacteria bacterium]|nr:amino acid ABC transporter permease [Deltaproteobacteria bacterium]
MSLWLFSRLRGLRPSNLVVLGATPFVIYIFASSARYQRALVHILGIEEHPWTLLGLFLFVVIGLLLGLFALKNAWSSLAPDQDEFQRNQRIRMSLVYGILHGTAVVLAGFAIDPTPLVESILVNDLDVSSTTWIVIDGQNRIAQPEILLWFRELIQQVCGYYLMLLVLAAFVFSRLYRSSQTLLKYGMLFFGVFNLGMFLYIFLIAHAGFASGLMATLRATFLAYAIASVFGLLLALLSELKVRERTFLIHTVVGVLLVAVSLWYFSRPQIEVVLVGNLDQRIAIIKGTPQGITNEIRDGEAFDLEGRSVKIRSVATVEKAIELFTKNNRISGALLPTTSVDPAWPVMWRTEYLAKEYSFRAYAIIVLGLGLLLLTGAGVLNRMHPLRVLAAFLIDTLRGIPMLVIVLYIGLPLAGAVKELSGGVISIPNMFRGIIAIGIGYSAYMAEIFRAGIEAIPKGQIEAARTMGLREWMIVRFVILPQAIKIITPALGNEFIAMLKDTALLSVLSIRDVTMRMREFQAATFLAFTPFNTAALLYVALTLAASSVLKTIERRQKVGEH